MESLKQQLAGLGAALLLLGSCNTNGSLTTSGLNPTAFDTTINGKKVELAAAATYGEIKMWFLTQFPEIEKLGENVNKIIEEARKAREAQKKAA